MKNKPNKCKTCKYGDSHCDWCMTDPDGSLNYEPKDDYDPIHAAGGCYCRECTKFRRYTKNNITFGICKRHNSEVRENDFCSYNDGKDGGNVEEFAALKEKEE